MLLNIHNQGTAQTPVAKKPPTLNNEIPTPSTATSSDSQTAGHYPHEKINRCLTDINRYL